MTLIFETWPDSTRAVRYLALGDSYTIGEGVAEFERWPNRFAELLRRAGQSVSIPKIIARTGWTTDELNAAMDQALASGQIEPSYDFVSLLIGVNNQYRGRTAAEYALEFEALLLRALSLAAGHASRVVVVSIPDWGVTEFGKADPRGAVQIGQEIDAFNASAKAVCAQFSVNFVDITPISRQHPDWTVADRLHPDGRQYQAWAIAVRDTLIRSAETRVVL